MDASGAGAVWLDKGVLRRGELSPGARRGAWLALASAGAAAGVALPALPASLPLPLAGGVHAYYRAALHEVFGANVPVPSRLFRIPFLGVEPAVLPAEATALLAQPSIAASAAHDRLIAVLAQLHALRYAPQVPALALALLRALPEAEAFAALQALLRAQASAARADGALPALLLSRREEHAFIKTFRTLVKSYHPRLSAHLEALGAPVRAVYASWFRGFFAGWLPPDDVVRVVDAYLLEGTKVLLRVGLALLRATKRKLKATTAPGDIDRVFRRWVARAVCLRAAAGAAPAPHGLAPALLAELASPAAADPLLPDEYSWPALSAGAFDGVTGLARGTIRKLLDKYLAAAAAAPGGGGGGGAGHGDARAGADTLLAELPPPSSASAAAALTPASSAPVPGALAPAPAATSTGVIYDSLGVDPAAVDEAGSSALGTWHNPKIVGIGARLMAADFAPANAAALVAGAREAGRRLRASLYQPPDDGVRQGWGLAADAAAAAAAGNAAQQLEDEAQDAPLRAAAGWVAAAHTLLTGARAPAPPSGVAPPPLAAAAVSAAASPHLASLAPLLPPSVAAHNWACAFSTDVHGWALASLYARTSGLAPLLVFIQAQVRGAGGAAEHGGAADAAAAGTARPAASAMSSRRPVFGFFASQGLRPVAPAGDAAPAAGAYGGRSDFVFQLFPELNLLPVSNAEIETSARTAGGGGVAFYAPSAGMSDVAGAGNRTQLRRDTFLTCLRDHLCVGGRRSASGGGSQSGAAASGTAAYALRLGADLGTAVAATSLLADLSVPLDASAAAAAAAAGGEVPLDVLAVEAFCFVDRAGAFLEHREARGTRDLVHAKTALLRTLADYFEAPPLDRPTAVLHTPRA